MVFQLPSKAPEVVKLLTAHLSHYRGLPNSGAEIADAQRRLVDAMHKVRPRLSHVCVRLSRLAPLPS